MSKPKGTERKRGKSPEWRSKGHRRHMDTIVELTLDRVFGRVKQEAKNGE